MLLLGFSFKTAFNTRNSVLLSTYSVVPLEAKWHNLWDSKCLHLEEMWERASWGYPGNTSQLTFSCLSMNFTFSTFNFLTGWKWQVENIRIGRLPRGIRHHLKASPEYLNHASYSSLFFDNLEWEMKIPALSAEWRVEEVAELE